MESHKDRPAGFQITAAELATSDGSQSSPCLVYTELVYNSSTVCKLLSKSRKLHTSKSAVIQSCTELYRVYPFVSFQQTWRESLPRCLRLHKAQPISPAWVHTVALPLVLNMVLFSRCRTGKLLVAKYDIIFEMEQEKKPNPWRSQTNSTSFDFFWEQYIFSL